jgi:hypothetical protein
MCVAGPYVCCRAGKKRCCPGFNPLCRPEFVSDNDNPGCCDFSISFMRVELMRNFSCMRLMRQEATSSKARHVKPDMNSACMRIPETRTYSRNDCVVGHQRADKAYLRQ